MSIQLKFDGLVQTDTFAVFSYPRCIFPRIRIDPVASPAAACWEFHLSWTGFTSRPSLSSVAGLLLDFPPGKAIGPCAAYTSPNYKDAHRVAFVPNKPPLLNYLNVPLRSRSGVPAHRAPAPLRLDGSAESLVAIGRAAWASTWVGEGMRGRARKWAYMWSCCVSVISVEITDRAEINKWIYKQINK